MKWQGESIYIPNTVTTTISRSDGTVLEFKFQAVEDMNTFQELCEKPTPPWVKNAKGKVKYQHNDEKYQEALTAWGKKNIVWITLKSLEATEDLEWEKVDINDPETYDYFDEELKESGFNQMERMKLIQSAMEVNSLNDDHIDHAQEDF